jgi:tetratricopeptide (TPR) repeat protein
MAPEQARGAVSQLDRRTDVFGLGAVLCEILTGQPPYVAERTEALLRAAEADQEEALARLGRCGADAELVALTRSCLSPAREARPRDGAAVAARLAAYREGVQERLRRSELEKAAALARAAEAKKRQRLTVALAVAVVLGLGTAGVGAWYFRQQQLERQAERDRQEAERLAEVSAALEDATRRKDEEPPERAWAALDRAEARLGDGGPEALRRRAEQVRAELERRRRDRQMLAKLEEARLRGASDGKEGFDHPGSDRQYQEAFRWYDLDVERLPPEEAATRARASALADDLLDALDDWARMIHAPNRKQQVLAVADRLDPDPWRRRLRQAVGARDVQAIQRLAGEPRPERLSSSAVVLLANALDFAGVSEKGLEALRQAQRRRPGDFWLAFELAHACQASGPDGREEAVRYYTASLALRPNSAPTHTNLGSALAAQGKLPEAVAEFQEALRLKPDYPDAHYNLGLTLQTQGKLPEAVAEYREALRLKPDSPDAHINLGNVLQDQGQLAEAVAEFREALRLEPDEPVTHNNLGNALSAQGKVTEAVAEFREALRLKPDYLEAHINLGDALSEQGKLPEAVAEYREALRLRPNYPAAHTHLGIALASQGKLAEAEAEFREAARLKPDDPKAHAILGNVLAAQGKLPEAVAQYRAALRLKPDDPNAHYGLGNALSDQEKWSEAVAEYREALRLKPDFPQAHYNLGNTLRHQGKLPEALTQYREALRLKPDHAEAHCNLGHALIDLGQFRPALDFLRRGHELGQKQPGWRYPSAAWVKQAERYVALEALLPRVLSGDERPTDDEWADLCQVCSWTHRPAAAARIYTAFFAEQPTLVPRYRSLAARAAARGGCGDGDGAQLDGRERARLRSQARTWLAADLAFLTRLVDNPPDAKARERVQQALRHRQQDADLTGVRHPWALWRLPADERRAWQQLWADVNALLHKAAAKD